MERNFQLLGSLAREVDQAFVSGSDRMRTTTDTYTGKRFRWNTTVSVGGVVVPARSTSRTTTNLHPNRVLPSLLAKLNEPAS